MTTLSPPLYNTDMRELTKSQLAVLDIVNEAREQRKLSHKLKTLIH
jgi:hypothetical protein